MMTHRAPTFSEHCIGLLKKRGSFAGPTGGHIREPVTPDRFRDVHFIGSDKIQQSEPFTKAGTTGTTRTTIGEQSRTHNRVGNFQARWWEIVAELKHRHPVPEFAPTRWQTLIDDAGIFLATWGETAHRLGWNGLDLFGVHPLAPAARYDLMGLIPLLRGDTVVELTDEGATICRPSGARLNYRRSDQTGAVCLSQLAQRGSRL